MRKLKQEEYELIIFLLKDTSNDLIFIENLNNRFVKEMADGGMGSLRFLPDSDARQFGEVIGLITLLDTDKMPVSFAVNIDKNGDIFELDVFKADFSPLKKFPVVPYLMLPPPLIL